MEETTSTMLSTNSKNWQHPAAAAGHAKPAGSAGPRQAAKGRRAGGHGRESLDRLRSAFQAGQRQRPSKRQRWLDQFGTELKSHIKQHAQQPGPTQWLKWGWDYEVLHDDKDPITIGKLLVLGFYIVVALMLAWVADWLVGRRLLPRLGLHRGRISAFKSILFYGLCLVFGFVAFRLLQIPLGAFAFLGGAVAIAVGFGSQDIMNNFMSGIILLAEQPIRVGDIIQLGDVQGQVAYIGLRSTRLLTDANHEMIVANKNLLDEQVTNLTLSDQFVRQIITINVDRTRPVFATKRRMMEIAFSHPLVIKSPSPVVLLTEVDTYALRFQVHFWMEHRSFMRCMVVQSEILERITAEFPPLDESPAEQASADAAANEPEATEADLQATAQAAPDQPPVGDLVPAEADERLLAAVRK